MDINDGKNNLIDVVRKQNLCPNLEEELVEKIRNHPDVPIRGIFQTLADSESTSLQKQDLKILNRLMHYFG